MLESLVARNTIIIISQAKGGINESEAVSCTRLARKTRFFLQCCPTADGDQPIHTSPIKIRKSKNTSSIPAVRVHPCERLNNFNTMYSSESQVIKEAPSAPSSEMTQASAASKWPITKPTWAAWAAGTFADSEPGVRAIVESL